MLIPEKPGSDRSDPGEADKDLARKIRRLKTWLLAIRRCRSVAFRATIIVASLDLLTAVLE
jgi:hypothetical protein